MQSRRRIPVLARRTARVPPGGPAPQDVDSRCVHLRPRRRRAGEDPCGAGRPGPAHRLGPGGALPGGGRHRRGAPGPADAVPRRDLHPGAVRTGHRRDLPTMAAPDTDVPTGARQTGDPARCGTARRPSPCSVGPTPPPALPGRPIGWGGRRRRWCASPPSPASTPCSPRRYRICRYLSDRARRATAPASSHAPASREGLFHRAPPTCHRPRPGRGRDCTFGELHADKA